MGFSKNHDHLYFDVLCRTKKAETILSLIHATYQAKINNGGKEEIARNLESAYNLFKFDAGTYDGSVSKFESQYTIGHELCIWKDSSLELTDLAIKVAENKITVRDYFDIIFLNYIQPIKNRVVHVLYVVLEYIEKNNFDRVSKDDLKNIFVDTPNGDINGLFNMLLGTNYFSTNDNRNLLLEVNIIDLKKSCNIEYHDKNYEEVKDILNNNNYFIQYLQEDHRNANLKQLFVKTESHFTESDKQGYNKIFYGIPGCGKSYHIEHKVLKNECVNKDKNVFRTTFYLDYSNSDFIGQIYPQVQSDGTVKYEPKPGPFTLALERAYSVENQMVFLIIEEINRGNAAAIFGDTFQLLDRLNEGYDERIPGDSEYPINNQFIYDYLKMKGVTIPNRGKGKIFIPRNLTILATMNTSDQNVFPLDTAFKRRWDRERIEQDWNEGGILDMYVPGTNCKWKYFANRVNRKLLESNAESDIMEDKQLGPYFVDETMLCLKPNEQDEDRLRKFTYNVIDYLYNDVTRFDHSILFKSETDDGSKKINSFQDIYEVIVDENYNDDFCMQIDIEVPQDDD